MIYQSVIIGGSSVAGAPAGGWDLSTASYDSVSFSVAGQETAPTGLAFKSDDTKMYIVGDANKTVYQYTLSTPSDLSSASYDSVSFSVISQTSQPTGIEFKPDGSKMYISTNGEFTYQYSLVTAWDVGTASYDSVSFDVSAQDTGYQGVAFKPDGTKMFISGVTTDSIYQYTLSTPWDLSTASYDSVSFSVASEDTGPLGLEFKSDGTKMFLMGNTNDSVFQYSLSTPWNIGTASYDGVSFSVTGQETTPQDVAVSMDGTKMFITGVITDTVYQYSL